ncbi:MAG: ABC transporter ATP-binding protein [Desulfovibrio sp.]
MRSDSMLATILSIYRRLDIALRTRFGVAVFTSLLVAFSQLCVIALLALLGGALSSPEDVIASNKISWLWTIIPISTWGEPKAFLLLLCSVTVITILLNNCLRALGSYWAIRLDREVERFFGLHLLSTFLQFPYEWHLRNNASDLSTGTLWVFFYGSTAKYLMILLCDLFSITIVLAGLLLIEPLVSLGCFGVLGVIGFVLFRSVRGALGRLSSKFAELQLERNRIVYKALQGIRDVKICGREENLRQEYQTCMEQLVQTGIRQEMARCMPMYLLESLGFAAICSVIALLLLQGGSYARITGTTTLLAATGWRILPCLNKVLDSLGAIRVGWPYVQKVEKYFYEIQTAVTEKNELGYPSHWPSMQKSLSLRSVDFQYASSPRRALTDIDIEILKGQAIGIIGHSGAGKSTLVNILNGLFVPKAGSICLDGVPLTLSDMRNWQIGELGYVPQDPYICDGTLSENIAYGVPAHEVDRAWVLECCNMAAVDFLCDLADGIDTAIGERGVLLSGGQQQRVAIARALYKRPEILVFDEATSSLDSKSEVAILNTIYAFKGKITLIIVAHRLSTVEGCDKLYWIERGKVHMEGKPSEVLNQYRNR